MNWCKLISDIYETRAGQPGIACEPKFYAAASAGEIADGEVRLDARLPASIRSLLLETNGVMEVMAIDGGEWFDSGWLLWTVAEIVEQNLSYRAASEDGRDERDFRQLVFFADAGADGILFAFPVREDRVCAPGVVAWHPIMDDLDELTPSLEGFLKGWLTGTITV
jgi:hypothetical protein